MMNQTTKILSLLLVLAMSLSLLAGCGAKTPAATEAPPQAAPTEAVPTANEAPAATEAPAPTQAPAPEGTGERIEPGDKMPDFSFTTYDGKTMTLYELLEEKDMVLVNFWAVYCGPCKMEFPYLQEVYEKYEDKAAVVALSTGETDTHEGLKDYAEDMGLTFYMGLDEHNLSDRIGAESVPTSMIIDRFGTVCLIESGSQPLESFESVFSIFTAEDYDKSLVMKGMLSTPADATPSSPEELTAALNVEGGKLAFTNPDNIFQWPMIVTEKDGRTVVEATNHGTPNSEALVQTTIDAKAGDAAVITFKMHNESFFEQMHIKVNGHTVKTFTSNRDWITYAHTFDKAGTYTLQVFYDRASASWVEDDRLWIDSIAHVTGDAAAAAVKQNPTYPVSDEIKMEFLDENGQLQYLELYITEEGKTDTLPLAMTESGNFRVKLQLDGSVDPETVSLNDVFGMKFGIASYAVEDGYIFDIELDPDFPICAVYTLEPQLNLDVFGTVANQSQIDMYMTIMESNGMTAALREIEPFELYVTEYDLIEGDLDFTVTYVDQNGDPVPGVMCQVCDETSCMLFISDANGQCQFTLPPNDYEIHLLKVPEGYEGDTTTITQAPLHGGDLEFTVTKK